MAFKNLNLIDYYFNITEKCFSPSWMQMYIKEKSSSASQD